MITVLGQNPDAHCSISPRLSSFIPLVIDIMQYRKYWGQNFAKPNEIYLFIYLLKIFKERDQFSNSCFTRGPPFNYEHIQCKI